MKRCKFQLNLLLILSLVMTVMPEAMAQQDRPNVLFIVVDDLNDWIGALNGHPQAKTPNLDRLAKKGVLFANAHAQAPLCNPSRISVLTGLRPSSTGIYGLAPRIRQVEKTRELTTLSQYFAKQGYYTMSAGKVLHGAVSRKERETEYMEWGPEGTRKGGAEGKIMRKRLDMVDNPLIDWGVLPHGNDTLLEDFQVATWAATRIRELEKEAGDRPFFMALGFRRPHVPLLATEKWFDPFPEEELILPPVPPHDRDDVPDFAWNLHWKLPEPRLSWLIREDEWKPMVRAYLACIHFVDAQIGRVLETLDNSRFNENTIVILWSDHGYHLGEKGISGKNSLWERSTRVPLIIAGPGIEGNRKCHEAVELLDIYPTLVELAGIGKKAGLEGQSLVPLLNDVNQDRMRPAITVHNPGNFAVRTERWRYILYADGSEELYDHARDPHEWINLAGLKQFGRIKKELAKWIPTQIEPLAPGSKNRILEERDGEWYWEGERIDRKNLVQ